MASMFRRLSHKMSNDDKEEKPQKTSKSQEKKKKKAAKRKHKKGKKDDKTSPERPHEGTDLAVGELDDVSEEPLDGATAAANVSSSAEETFGGYHDVLQEFQISESLLDDSVMRESRAKEDSSFANQSCDELSQSNVSSEDITADTPVANGSEVAGQVITKNEDGRQEHENNATTETEETAHDNDVAADNMQTLDGDIEVGKAQKESKNQTNSDPTDIGNTLNFQNEETLDHKTDDSSDDKALNTETTSSERDNIESKEDAIEGKSEQPLSVVPETEIAQVKSIDNSDDKSAANAVEVIDSKNTSSADVELGKEEEENIQGGDTQVSSTNSVTVTTEHEENSTTEQINHVEALTNKQSNHIDGEVICEKIDSGSVSDSGETEPDNKSISNLAPVSTESVMSKQADESISSSVKQEVGDIEGQASQEETSPLKESVVSGQASAISAEDDSERTIKEQANEKETEQEDGTGTKPHLESEALPGSVKLPQQEAISADQGDNGSPKEQETLTTDEQERMPNKDELSSSSSKCQDEPSSIEEQTANTPTEEVAGSAGEHDIDSPDGRNKMDVSTNEQPTSEDKDQSTSCQEERKPSPEPENVLDSVKEEQQLTSEEKTDSTDGMPGKESEKQVTIQEDAKAAKDENVGTGTNLEEVGTLTKGKASNLIRKFQSNLDVSNVDGSDKKSASQRPKSMAGGSDYDDDDPGHTQLHLAAMDCDVDEVKRILEEEGVDVNKNNKRFRTALHEMVLSYNSFHPLDKEDAHEEFLEILHLLKGKGLKINMDDFHGKTCLHYAAEVGARTTILRPLVAAGARINTPCSDKLQQTALHIAVLAGFAGNVQTLLDEAADPNLRDTRGQTPLHVAAKAGIRHLPIVEVLLRCGADVKACDHGLRTPLHLAARAGRLGTAQSLVHAGADANARDSSGQTPLHLATVHDLTGEVTSFLLKSVDTDVNATDAVYEETALHKAVRFQTIHSFRHIVRCPRALPGLKDVSGETPMHKAAVIFNTFVWKELFCLGGDPLIPNDAGYTPLQKAIKTKNNIALMMMRQYGFNDF